MYNVSFYFFFFCHHRHICKLHEAINSILPKTQIQYLYRRIHITFKEILHECINKMDNSNSDGPLRG